MSSTLKRKRPAPIQVPRRGNLSGQPPRRLSAKRSCAVLDSWDEAQKEGVATVQLPTKVSVRATALRPGLTSLTKGDRISFLLSGHNARDVELVEPPATPSAATTLPIVSAAASSSSSKPTKAVGKQRKAIGRVVAKPSLFSVSAPAADFEPDPFLPGDPSCNLAQALERHRLRLQESELADAYKNVVAEFVSTQLWRLHADHNSVADDASADRTKAMQEHMLAWGAKAPSGADICAAHAVLIPGGGHVRSTNVRVGGTSFGTPSEQVTSELDKLATAVRELLERADISPAAKAAWVCYQLCSLHPFRDGNGRIARGLANAVLARCGLPFVVGFAASSSHRSAYTNALREGRTSSSFSRPLAVVVRAAVARGWMALEAAWEEKRRAVAAATDGLKFRNMREEARNGLCAICQDVRPMMSQLCCGAAYHVTCISRWLQMHKTCPTCREELPQTELPQTSSPRVQYVYAHVDSGSRDEITRDDTQDDTRNTWDEGGTGGTEEGHGTEEHRDTEEDGGTEEQGGIEGGGGTEDDRGTREDFGTEEGHGTGEDRGTEEYRGTEEDGGTEEDHGTGECSGTEEDRGTEEDTGTQG